MKRYLAFSREQYYPYGGWGDFVGDFDSTDECIAACNALMTSGETVGSHVVDTETMSKVLEWDVGCQPSAPDKFYRPTGWRNHH